MDETVLLTPIYFHTPSPYPDLPRDGRRNHRAAPLLQQNYRAFGCAHQGIDVRALGIYETRSTGSHALNCYNLPVLSCVGDAIARRNMA